MPIPLDVLNEIAALFCPFCGLLFDSGNRKANYHLLVGHVQFHENDWKEFMDIMFDNRDFME